jgi:hypothetical protein
MRNFRHRVARVHADALVEHLGFDGPGAAETPVIHGHLLDKRELDFVHGLEAVNVLLKGFFEAGARLIAEDDAVGEQAVAQGVLGGAALPRFGFWSVRARPIGTRGQDLFFGSHTILRLQDRAEV